MWLKLQKLRPLAQDQGTSNILFVVSVSYTVCPTKSAPRILGPGKGAFLRPNGKGTNHRALHATSHQLGAGATRISFRRFKTSPKLGPKNKKKTLHPLLCKEEPPPCVALQTEDTNNQVLLSGVDGILLHDLEEVLKLIFLRGQQVLVVHPFQGTGPQIPR